MILSGKEILKNIESKDIIIEPFDKSRVNPNSYNLTLSDELLVYENDLLDMKIPNETRLIKIPEEGLVLEPNKLYLGRTNEFTKTEKFVPMLEGRSSTGRLGLFIHVTAGFGDIGFAGYWTLEIFCVQPINMTYTRVASTRTIQVSSHHLCTRTLNKDVPIIKIIKRAMACLLLVDL